MAIERCAVLGAGVMGAGIAAHLANAGVSVLLLDLPGPPDDRNRAASRGLRGAQNADPAALMHRRNARRISVGNFDDDLAGLAECDWIIEAVVERLDTKHALYKRVEAVCRADTIISSNTSTIPLKQLVAPFPEAFCERFLITHFFNPPRYMRLLELVKGPQTRGDVISTITDFCDRALGKGVVEGKDTPGFIANRIGAMWLGLGVSAAEQAGLPVEAADAVVGPPFGIPKTGVFGLLDLVGLDLMADVRASMDALLPADDPIRKLPPAPAFLGRLVADGYTGRKGKGGFYRLNREEGVRTALDLTTGEYRRSEKIRPMCLAALKRGGLRAMLEADDAAARYAWQVMSRTLVYSASLVPEIADGIADLDEAVRLGFRWERGPFQLIDELGIQWLVERVRADGLDVPPLLQAAQNAGGFYAQQDSASGREQPCGPTVLNVAGIRAPIHRRPGTLHLSDVKGAREAEAKNGSASVWDIGEGVLCLEFHTKFNALDAGVLEMIQRAIGLAANRRRGLVIFNEGENFSVGANVGVILFASHLAMWDALELGLSAGQDAYKALKYAPFPVVGAPSGMALGGGCEILLHCDAVQAHAETYMGLVEAGVGLLPGWGGCKEMIVRWLDHDKRPGGPMPAIRKAFELISLATVARSADEARDHLLLLPRDRVTMNRERLLADARERVLELAEGYVAPEPPNVRLPGPSARAALALAVNGFHQVGLASAHDVAVAGAVGDVVSGGDTDITDQLGEDDLLALERQAFLSLIRTAPTAARLEHMLATGKPLRN